MNEKYFLALFNEETWNEFLESNASVYGTNSSRMKSMGSTNPGDFLICYVTKLSRFVGILEITSTAYLDNTHIWKGGIYPVRVNVRPIYITKIENGIPVLDIKEDLMEFYKLNDQKHWGLLFRTPLKIIQETDAKTIIKKLKEASTKQLI